MGDWGRTCVHWPERCECLFYPRYLFGCDSQHLCSLKSEPSIRIFPHKHVTLTEFCNLEVMTIPLLRGKSLFSRMSRASVPSSIKSSLVMTPIVLVPEKSEVPNWHNISADQSMHEQHGTLPWGSTSLAILRASELARSVLAGETARMRQLSLLMNSKSMLRIWISMSGGWSPTATLVIPGKSIRVKFSTVGTGQNAGRCFHTHCKHERVRFWRRLIPCGEVTLRLMGMLEMPLLLPVTRSVSSSISLRTISKSVKILPLQCTNSAYSAKRQITLVTRDWRTDIRQNTAADLPCLPLISCNTRGRLVTIPEPRGKKSLQKKHSKRTSE